ncbi:MAG: SUMF1/EgtB/PvdO family nonheme iron enzyme [Chloroflexaceae bacterium]
MDTNIQAIVEQLRQLPRAARQMMLDTMQPEIRAAVEQALAGDTSPQPAGTTYGSADIGGDNSGQNIGVNSGTVQQFFGAAPPVDGAKLLAAYLTSLISECQQLRLQRLVDQAQTGGEQHAVPQLKLQAVYTGLTTGGESVTLHTRTYPAARMARLGKRLRERPADQVPPAEVRTIKIDFCDAPDAAFYARIGKQRGGALTFDDRDDLPEDMPLRLTIARPELATEALQKHPRLVLLGEPGSGKSTVLRYLALLLALRIQGQAVELPAGWAATAPPVPVFCPLGTVAELLRNDQPDPDQALWQAITRALDDRQQSRAGLRDHLLEAIRRGGVLLLFDGLDELPTSGDNPRRQVAQAVCRFAIQTAPATPIVVTSRTKPYQESAAWHLPAAEGWQVRTIAPLAFGQVRQFVQQWYTELADTFDEPAAARAGRLIAALQDTRNDRIQKLIESPLLLTMLAILHYNRNELPDDRVEVYEQCVELLLDRWEPRRTPGVQREGLLARLAIPDLKLEQLREELHKLALQAQVQPPADDGRGMLDRYMLTGRLVEFFARLRCPDPLAQVNLFIDGLVREAGLLQAPADDRYAFPHLTFQEYLAACGLAGRPDMVNAAYGYWTGSDVTRWREVLLLFVGRLRQQGSLSVEQYAVPWLERLSAVKLGKQRKDPVQRAHDAALAALSYRELGGPTALAGTQLDVEAKIEAPLRAAIVDLLHTPDSGVVLEDRLTAAHVLADLGDPRFPVTLDEWRKEITRRSEQFGQPHGYGCYVRPGSYRIGGWEDGETSADIVLPGFWIARYPITVAQYAAFIAAGGYNEQRYWTPEGWKWQQKHNRTQPRFWSDAHYNSPNQALVGVTWYECMAFCAWLTAHLADTGYAVRLPTEAEWEAAAAYDRQMERRSFPWGADAPTPEHAIFEDDQGNNLGAPAPVGVCPAGAAACGALDMGGQVWEYCRSSHQAYPQAADAAQEDFTPDEFDVPRRGGSWWNNSTSVRCAARSGSVPNYWFDNDYGLRVLFSPCVQNECS